MPDAYRGLARWYDLATARGLRGARGDLADLCVSLGPGPVLDVGCGTGVLGDMLLARGLSVVGLDRSPAMLAVASGRSCARLVRGALPLPFADQTFGTAVLSMVLHETDDPEETLRECLRVTSNVVVLDWRMPERNLDLLAQPLVLAVERLAGADHYRRFRQYAHGGYLRGLAARCGATIREERALRVGSLVLAVVHRP